MAFKVILDAGHGGLDPGAVYNGRQEKDDVLRLAMAVGSILQSRGIEVEYTRTEDVYDTPFAKAQKGNASGADLFVSIHRNSFPTAESAKGVETLVYDKSGKKVEIADAINEQLENVGFVNLGVKERPNLVVLKRTQMPAVLVEVGFINNSEDNELFDREFDAIAEGIADGIIGEASQIEGEELADVYSVQVGAFRNQSYANRLLNEMLELDLPAYIEEERGLYRVRVGEYPGIDEAAKMEQRIRREGYQTILVRR